MLGPVFITDRGKPSHVLLSIEEYQRITTTRESIAEEAHRSRTMRLVPWRIPYAEKLKRLKAH